MEPAGQKDEPLSTKERRPVKCPSQVGGGWEEGKSVAELGKMMGSPGGLCCEVGPSRAGTLVSLESWVCSSKPGHVFAYLAHLRFLILGQRHRFSNTEAPSTPVEGRGIKPNTSPDPTCKDGLPKQVPNIVGL